MACARITYSLHLIDRTNPRFPAWQWGVFTLLRQFSSHCHGNTAHVATETQLTLPRKHSSRCHGNTARVAMETQLTLPRKHSLLCHGNTARIATAIQLALPRQHSSRCHGNTAHVATETRRPSFDTLITDAIALVLTYRHAFNMCQTDNTCRLTDGDKRKVISSTIWCDQQLLFNYMEWSLMMTGNYSVL